MLSSLSRFRDYRSRRVASQDPTGGNHDWIDIQPGETRTFARLAGPGCVRHIWCTMLFPSDDFFRRIVLRIFWDDCDEPSVECPIGDFFGLGHGMRKNFSTAVLSMSPQDGRAFNSWWPMPFRRAARFELENPTAEKFPFYFYVDYEEYAATNALDGHGYFHVQWRRENPTGGWGEEYEELRKQDWNAWARKTWYGEDPRGLNQDGRENYVILEAEGDGIYCGAHLDIDIFERQKNDWYGEGDDMVFIDDDLSDGRAQGAEAKSSGGAPSPASLQNPRSKLENAASEFVPYSTPRFTTLTPIRPPTLHGTGTEDWCNTAFGPYTEFVGPYHGILLYTGTEEWKWRGKQSIYRYYVEDPIRFRRAILATIEHGHANKLSNDYSSTAYYYLVQPRRGGPPLPPVAARLPRPNK